MREIKFRGKSKLGMNPLVKGFLLIDEMNNKFIAFKPDDDDFKLCPIEEDSDGQYTGLKDKNGKEIYEGDIVTDGYDKGKVIYDNESAQFRVDFSPMDDGLQEMCTPNWAIVIGNIYENPELLDNAL
jgi:hypothetical protein